MRRNKFWLFSLFIFLCSAILAFSFFASSPTAYAESVSSSALPNAFSLFDLSSTSLYDGQSGVETASLTPNVGDQKSTEICWTYATNTALETSIYMKAKQDSSFAPSTKLDFSELDIAYTLFKKRGLNTLAGGTIDLSTEYLTGEYGPVWQQSWEQALITSGDRNIANQNAFSNYEMMLTQNSVEHSGYCVMDAYFFPSRSVLQNTYSGTTLQEKVGELRTSIKNHIYNYGGVMATIFMGNGYLSGNKYIVDSDITQNHMITLVGWNDECELQRNGVTHTGAYIAQNSYGTNWGSGGYFYIMYDDVNVEDGVCGFTKIGHTLQSTDSQSITRYNNTTGLTYNGLDYENQFVIYNGSTVSVWSVTVDSNVCVSNIFKVNDASQPNRIVRLKIPCASPFNNFPQTTFRVYVIDDISSNVATNASSIAGVLKSSYSRKRTVVDADGNSTFTTKFTGLYTIDLGSNSIELEGEYFAVVMEASSGSVLYIGNMDHNLSYDYHNTFVSYNHGSTWGEYYSGETYCILPMEVETASSTGTISYTASDTTTTYNGQNIAPDITVTSPSSYTISYFVNNAWTTVMPSFYDVGTYTVPFRITQTGYETIEDSVIVTINPRPLTITPRSGQGKEYGRSDPTLTFDVSNTAMGDTLEFYGSLLRTSGENVGSYDILLGTLVVLNSNYSISFTSGVAFTISPRTLTITPGYKTSIYGDGLATLTYSCSGAVSTEVPNIDITLVVTRLDSDKNMLPVTVKDVGYYDIYYTSLSLEDSGTFKASNYTPVFSGEQNKYYISPRNVNIYPNDMSKTYGQDDPELTFTYDNVAAGETAAFSGNLSRDAGEDVGSYPINLGDLSLSSSGLFKSSNYTMSLARNAYFTIINDDLNDVFTIKSEVVTYDGMAHSITVSYSSPITALFMIVDNASVQFNADFASDKLPTYSAVGTYILKVQFSAPNFNPTIATATLTITRRDIVVMPDSSSKLYGGMDNLTYTYSGQATGQTPAFNGRLTRDSGESVGDYPITIGTLTLKDNGAFKSSNYNLVFTSGVIFSINKRPLVVTPITGQKKIYNTDDEALLYRYTGEQFQDIISFRGALARESGENVGSYAISLGTLSLDERLEDNYEIALSETVVYFSITPQTLIIQVNDKSAYYGEIDTDFSYTIDPSTIDNYKDGEDLLLTYSCLDDRGQPITNSTLRKESGYVINAQSHNFNYVITIQSGRYYIMYREYDIVFYIFSDSYTFRFSHFDTLGDVESQLDIDRKGYSFSYWQDEYTTYSSLGDYVVEGDVTFTAVYDLVTLYITYELNEGYFGETAIYSFTVEDTLDLISPLKIGHDFDGFYLDSEFSSRKVTSIDRDFDEDITLYAKWNAKNYDVTLPQGNQTYSISAISSKAVYGRSYFFSLRLNYAYDKSAVSVTCTYLKTSSTVSAQKESEYRTTSTTSERGDLVIKYKIESVQDSDFEISVSGIALNEYVINFRRFKDLENYRARNIDIYKNEENSVIMYSRRVTHGQELAVVPTPYSFAHYTKTPPIWDKTDFSSITEDVNVYAIYFIDTFIVTFVCDDGSTFETEVAYDDAFSTRALESSLGLSFMYKIVYNEEDIDGVVRVTDDITVHYYILDYSIYVVYGIMGVFGLIIIYFIISFLHYKFYLFRRRRNLTSK